MQAIHSSCTYFSLPSWWIYFSCFRSSRLLFMPSWSRTQYCHKISTSVLLHNWQLFSLLQGPLLNIFRVLYTLRYKLRISLLVAKYLRQPSRSVFSIYQRLRNMYLAAGDTVPTTVHCWFKNYVYYCAAVTLASVPPNNIVCMLV